MSRTDALEANLLALVRLVGDLQSNAEAMKALYLELKLQIRDLEERICSLEEERDDGQA